MAQPLILPTPNTRTAKATINTRTVKTIATANNSNSNSHTAVIHVHPSNHQPIPPHHLTIKPTAPRTAATIPRMVNSLQHTQHTRLKINTQEDILNRNNNNNRFKINIREGILNRNNNNSRFKINIREAILNRNHNNNNSSRSQYIQPLALSKHNMLTTRVQ
jgi:hypothetical protein